MPKQQQGQQKKGCDKARVNKAKVAAYWNWHHTPNMFRRVKRVFQKYQGMGLNVVAVREAKKCATAHGPVVEGMLARWLRGERP